jgi:L-ascorbate metabolism protein UlaG (beta-lactamase superfamily)
MKKILILIAVIILGIGLYKLVFKQKHMTIQDVISDMSEIGIYPISHATALINWGEEVIYTDPVGGAKAFADLDEPGIILVTDIHSDHLSIETLSATVKENTVIIAPKAVADLLPEKLLAKTVVSANGEKTTQKGFSIEAVPMYNLPEDPKSFHTKGRGNGYVVEKSGKRLYIAGDTSGTPEMRALKNIDIALVPMNLPYTMSVEEAASAVLDFAPREVYPYHYRGINGLSDVNKFKELVNAGNPNIMVELLNWYPETK